VNRDVLRQIELLADLPHHRLARASRRLVWRCYDPGELILPHQVPIHLDGLVYRGRVQIAAVRQGHRYITGHIRAGEPIHDDLWTSHTPPIELRAAEPSILCFLPPRGTQAATFPGLPPNALPPVRFPRMPSDAWQATPFPKHRPESATSSIDVVPGITSSATWRTFRILLTSIVLVLGLTAWCWPSSWRMPLSELTYALASNRLEASEYTEALSLLQTSLDLDPRMTSAYNDMGYVLHQQGRPNEARAAFQRAVELDPEFAVAQNNLGLSHLEGGQLDLAREALQQAVKLNPESVAAWTNLGVAEQLADQTEEATRAYRAALRLNPHSAVAQVNLGVLYYERERPSEARGYLEAALDAQPNLPRARTILGAIALSEDDYARAQSELQAAASDLADDPLLHFYLALWYEEASLWESAEQELGRVLELQPHPDLAALARSHLVALTPSDPSLSAEEANKKGE
jgi:Flp pilus assembly protein TadD